MHKNYLWIFILIVFFNRPGFASESSSQIKEYKNQAEEYYVQEMYDEAIVEYKKAIKIDPDDPDLYYDLGRALEENTLYSRALEAYKKTIELNPDHWQALTGAADVCREMDDFVHAEEFYNQAIKLRPEVSALYHKSAITLIKQKRYPEAIDKSKRALVMSPLNFDARFTLAEAYFHNQDINRALAEFNFIRNEEPTKLAVLKWVGYIYLKQEEYGLAKDILAEFVEIDAEDAWGHYYLALAYERLRQNKEAIKEYEKALELSPEEKIFYVNISKRYFHNGKYGRVVQILEQAQKYDPDYYLNFLLAVAYGAEGNNDQMINTLKEAGPFIWTVPAFLLSIFFIFLLFAGGLFFIVFLAGKKNKADKHSEQNINWGGRELFFITIALFILPVIIGMAVGKFLYNNWFLIFSPSTNISSRSVLAVLSTQVIANFVIIMIIFNFLKLGVRKSAGVLGIVPVNLAKSIRQAILAVIVLMGFSIIYYNVYFSLSGNELPQQAISQIISQVSTLKQALPILLVVVCVAPVAEEIIFRGFFYQGLKRYCGMKMAMVISAIFFAMMHYQLAVFLPIMFMGIVFAYLYEKNKSILPSVIAHLIWNGLSFMFIFAAPK
ncbi:MAG: tetratricopeptide repeat protein [Candidatus Omnitrophota bacterium]